MVISAICILPYYEANIGSHKWPKLDVTIVHLQNLLTIQGFAFGQIKKTNMQSFDNCKSCWSKICNRFRLRFYLALCYDKCSTSVMTMLRKSMFVRFDLDHLRHLVILSASNICISDVDYVGREGKGCSRGCCDNEPWCAIFTFRGM